MLTGSSSDSGLCYCTVIQLWFKLILLHCVKSTCINQSQQSCIAFKSFFLCLKSDLWFEIQIQWVGEWGIIKKKTKKNRGLCRLIFVMAQYCFIDLFIFKFSFAFIFQGRGERAYDIYSRLLRERIICVMGPVSVCLKVGTTWPFFPFNMFPK